MLNDDNVTARLLAVAFVIYGLIAIAFLGVNMPPFQNPDEPNHFLKTAQIADGRLFSTRFSGTAADGSTIAYAGGRVDPGPLIAYRLFTGLIAHPDVRATRAYWEPRVLWSNERVMLGFPNTAMYPPVLYTPAAVGVVIGRVARWSVTRTLALSRVLTGVAAVALGAVAVAVAGAGAASIFAVLTLPMSLSLMASVSQDALLLSCSALVGAILLRLRRETARPEAWLAALVGLLVLIVTAKPPYAPLGLIVLGVSAVRWRARIVALAVIVAAVVGWSAFVAATAYTNFGHRPGTPVDPSAQVSLLIEHPARIFVVVWRTFSDSSGLYLNEFIGRLGWLDTVLPALYQWTAVAMLGVAAVVSSLPVRRDPAGAFGRASITAGILLAAFGTVVSFYISWTAPGDPLIDGFQGRYFLPLALTAVGLLPALVRPRLRRLRLALLAGVAAFPIVSLGTVMWAVIERYYLS